MELLWAVYKLLDFLIFGPVWWLASAMAAPFFPFEGDANHTLLALVFSVIILGLLVWGGVVFF